MNIPPLNLRIKLSILAILLALLTSTAIAISVYYLWTGQIKKQVGQQLEKNTLFAAHSIQQQMNYYKGNLSTWSQLDVMVDIISQDVDKRIINTLLLLKKNYHLPGNLIVLNKNLDIIANTGEDDFDTEQSIQDHLPDATNLTSRMFIHSPIKLSILPDEISGYILFTLPWKTIIESLSTLIPEFLIAQNNQLEYFFNGIPQTTHPLPPLHASNPNWNIQSKQKLHSQANTLFTIPNESILLYGVSNKDKALQPVKDTLLLISAVTFALIIPIAILSIWISTRFVKPIIMLQEFAETIADSGDLKIDLPAMPHDEVGRLGQILQRMTINLKKSFGENQKANHELKLLTENLEIRVDERTHELTQALHQLKKAQSQLVQSEKMGGLGQLVAGIAHELNNPISAIYANTPILDEYIQDLMSIIDKLQHSESIDMTQLSIWLEEIDYAFLKEDASSLLTGQLDSAKRIRDIILSLRNFSRVDEAELKFANINEGIDNTLNILRHQIKHRIEIHKDFQLNQNIECYPGEINQVIMNILANAGQAIKDQGNIWITSKLINDCQAEIQIKDDGPGIPENILSKIFDPFFTTKIIGEGTGLGLSISYGIIERHHGQLNVQNYEPHGVIFTITLPISQDENK